MNAETKLTFNEEALKGIVAKAVSVQGMTVAAVKIVTKTVPSGDRGEYSETVVSAEAILKPA